MFELNLGRFKDKTALCEGEKSVSYEELESLCNSFESELPRSKQLVAIQMQNSIDTIVAYLSFLRLNYALICIDATLNESLKDEIYKRYKPNLIYKNSQLSRYSDVKIDIYKNLSLLLSTSGSTGSPKMVKLTKENIYHNTISILKYLPITKRDRTITTLPLYYSYGLSVIHTHLSVGATIVLNSDSIISKEFWESFNLHNITNLNGVPYHYEMLKRIGFLKKEYRKLKFLTQAGGKLNKKLVQEFALWAEKNGSRFYVMYGQSEATARIAYLEPDKIFEKTDSIGRAISGGKLSLKNTNIPYQEDELIYEGKNVMLGYAKDFNELSRGDELHGRLDTGDIGYVDEDGYFYITGRSKRFIKLFGNRINLDEIEQFLNSYYKSIAVIGVDNSIMVVTAHHEEGIKEKLMERYGFHHSALHVKHSESIIFKDNKKVDYQAMIERYL